MEWHGAVLHAHRGGQRPDLARAYRGRQSRQRTRWHCGVSQRSKECGDDGSLRFVDSQCRTSDGRQSAVLWQSTPGASASAGVAGAKGCGRSADLHARALALTAAEDECRGRKRYLLRKAYGQRSRRGQSGPRCGAREESHCSDWHAAPQRTLSDCRARLGSLQSSRRSYQI